MRESHILYRRHLETTCISNVAAQTVDHDIRCSTDTSSCPIMGAMRNDSSVHPWGWNGEEMRRRGMNFVILNWCHVPNLAAGVYVPQRVEKACVNRCDDLAIMLSKSMEHVYWILVSRQWPWPLYYPKDDHSTHTWPEYSTTRAN